MYEFKLPDVGEGIHEAEILRWLVKTGDSVTQDQPMLEVQTDKAVVEIPSPVAGTIAEIRTPIGTVAEVGNVLVVIEPAGQQGEQPKGESVKRGEDGAPVPIAPAVAQPSSSSPQRILAAPAVRRLALELGVDIAQIPGSGPAGRILPADVRQFIQQQRAPAAPEPAPGPSIDHKTITVMEMGQTPPAPAPSPPPPAPAGEEVTEREALQGLRRRIAERMEEAWRTPHVTSFEEADISKLVTLRQELKTEAEQQGTRLTYLPFIIKAAIQALKEFPDFNASLDMARQEILRHRYYHIGVATAIPEGLVVPVVRHADRLNLLQIATELSRLAESARERRLTVKELSGSTFTITNFGSFGGQQGTPIINPPEAAILGCGRIEDKVVVVEGRIEIRPIMPLALSYDHRLIDGAAAAQFLGRIKALLVNPNLLLLEL